MREIKFRSWNKERKYMEVRNFNLVYQKIIERWTHPDKLPLMQSTGLKDKNGKDIYEGDIFKKGYYDKDKPILYIVEWREKDASYGWKQIVPVLTESFEMKDVEVIGNIYENSELK